MRRALFVCCLVAALGSVGAAKAADVDTTAPPMVSDPFFNEVRLGVMGHGIDTSDEMGDVDLNVELLFSKPFHADGWVEYLIPRPHVGATIDFDGRTSTAYAGVTWHVQPFEFPVFVEASFGGSVNNGKDEGSENRIAVGCNLLFRESAALGYQFDEHWSVIASIEHNSNAGLCSENRGNTNAGMKIGYKF